MEEKIENKQKMDKYFETIIVGGGPGGLIAGSYLENALIIEQKKEIGKPVQCGEGISKKALEIQKIKPDSGWICCKIHKVERIMPNQKIIGKSHQDIIGYTINRSRFEKFLAKKLKAKMKLNTRVVDIKKDKDTWKVTTSSGEIFKSKYLIGADGVNSIVRKLIFKNKLNTIGAIAYIIKLEKKIDTRNLKIYFDNEKYPQGYAWIFPQSKNTANIGIGGKDRNLVKKFKDFLEEEVKKEYGKYSLIENRSGAIPLRPTELSLFKDNVLLLGDAAGLIDPIFKGGISQAMLSGKIAAQCILENQTSQYEKKIKMLPFANKKIIKASEIFNSFDNQTLNELGEILEEKGTSYLKTNQGLLEIKSKLCLKKNFSKIFEFFSLWWDTRDYLW
ncbi:MAG: NAD(P)/FAD-dependent oxidoreductase [Candidatus Nealsonbacteria bacterium]|nr:NAD(P)/FAD-dependent oxidoreductase [Candidatus Nealsonbacteria bacterium]